MRTVYLSDTIAIALENGSLLRMEESMSDNTKLFVLVLVGTSLALVARPLAAKVGVPV